MLPVERPPTAAAVTCDTVSQPPPASPDPFSAASSEAPSASYPARPSERSSTTGLPTGVDVLLYDGVCALCNGLVRFLLARDRERRFRYAPLQSEFARNALAPYGEDPGALSTVFLLQSFGQPDQRVLRRSRAALAAMRRLGGGWGLTAAALSVLPTLLLDVAYRVVAGRRYSIFGRYDSCPLPAPEHRSLFIDSAARPAP
jgi:predicted DCC family thiol-disulfide oxidoreductase YuxK